MAAFSKGATIIESPASYKEMTERNLHVKYSAGALIDESANPWCSKKANFPAVFVIQLVEQYNINTIELSLIHI